MDEIRALLKESGYRITPGRVQLLTILKKSPTPLSIREISERTEGHLLDQVTLYRALESLSNANIVNRVDLNSGVARYEYIAGKKHHHHIVCRDCGKVEDVSGAALEKELGRLAQDSKQFKSIYSHNVEFFGSCKACTK